MVFTVEPGIYIRPDALSVLPKTPENERFIAAVRPAFEKYSGKEQKKKYKDWTPTMAAGMTDHVWSMPELFPRAIFKTA